jgi:hypothetical protein
MAQATRERLAHKSGQMSSSCTRVWAGNVALSRERLADGMHTIQVTRYCSKSQLPVTPVKRTSSSRCRLCIFI